MLVILIIAWEATFLFFTISDYTKDRDIKEWIVYLVAPFGLLFKFPKYSVSGKQAIFQIIKQVSDDQLAVKDLIHNLSDSISSTHSSEEDNIIELQ